MSRRNSVLVSRTLYQVGVATLVAAIMWVAIGVYLTLTKTVTVEVEKTVIEPLVTKLDMEIVEQLASRLKVEVIPQVSTASAEIATQAPEINVVESVAPEITEDVTIEVTNEDEPIN